MPFLACKHSAGCGTTQGKPSDANEIRLHLRTLYRGLSIDIGIIMHFGRIHDTAIVSGTLNILQIDIGSCLGLYFLYTYNCVYVRICIYM